MLAQCESKLAFISSNSPLTEIFYVSHCTIIPKLTTDHTVNLKWPPARQAWCDGEEFRHRVRMSGSISIITAHKLYSLEPVDYPPYSWLPFYKNGDDNSTHHGVIVRNK